MSSNFPIGPSPQGKGNEARDRTKVPRNAGAWVGKDPEEVHMPKEGEQSWVPFAGG